MQSFTLTQRLLVFILIPLLGVFTLIGLLVHQQLNQSLPILIEEAAEQQLMARGDEVARWLHGYRYWVHTLAKDPFLVDLSAVDDTQRLQTWLSARHAGDRAIESFYYADVTGEFITHAGVRGNVSQRDYFRELVSAGTVNQVFTNPIPSLVSGLPISIIAEPIFNAQGQRVGLLGITLTMQEVSKTIAAMGLGEGSYGWLIDNSGRMIAHPDEAVRMQLSVGDAEQHGFRGFSTYAPRMLQGQAGQGEIHAPTGDALVIFWTPIPDTQWSIGFSIPRDNFTALSRKLLKNIAFTMVVAFVLLVLIITLVARHQLSPIQDMVQGLHRIVDARQADLTQRLPEKRNDELGKLAHEFNLFIARISDLIAEVMQVTQNLNQHAQQIRSGGQLMQSHMQNQQQEASSLTHAMDQLVISVDEIAHYAQSASSTALEGESRMDAGTIQIQQVMQIIQAQSQTIEHTSSQVEQLHGAGSKIGEIMEVIRSVAEQTNLLALNAAIEAARAGEAGRGFAVVADEVRTLAARTHESTAQIQTTIEELQKHIQDTVKTMHTATMQTQNSVAEAQQAEETLQSINAAMDSIKTMNVQIATATQEQSSTVDEFSRNLQNLVTLGQSTQQEADQVAVYGENLQRSAKKLSELIQRFKV